MIVALDWTIIDEAHRRGIKSDGYITRMWNVASEYQPEEYLREQMMCGEEEYAEETAGFRKQPKSLLHTIQTW